MFLKKLRRRSGIADQPGLEWVPGASGVDLNPPDTPFLHARQIVDNAVGAVWTIAYTASSIAAFFALTTIGAGYGWYVQSQKSDLKVLQQVVNADGGLGELRFAEPLKFSTAMFDQVLRRLITSCFTKYGSHDGNNNATNDSRQYCAIVASGSAVEPINDRVINVIDKEFSNFVQIQRITPDPNQNGWFNVVWDEETARPDGKAGECRRSSGNFHLEQIPKINSQDFIRRPTFVLLTSAQFGYEGRGVSGRCAW